MDDFFLVEYGLGHVFQGVMIKMKVFAEMRV